MTRPCANPLCKHSRSGHRATVKAAHEVCGEWKCRACCPCGQEGKLTGRARSRSARAAQASRSPVPAAPENVFVRSVGRPPAPSVALVPQGQFLPQLVSEVRTATTEIVACSLSYDDRDLHRALLARARARPAVRVELFVDKQQLNSGRPTFERERLRELAAAGAVVWTVRGQSHSSLFGEGGNTVFGHLHSKALVLDKKVAYAGSANLTRNSRCDEDVVFRFAGGRVVQDLYERITSYRSGAQSFP
jgi:phosphatidylserine/phosphatidylglycerophosphate/cardiolipin synthase-like enzyme